MIIYTENGKTKLFYPSTSSFPLSTEVKVLEICRNKDCSKVQLRINGIVFFNQQVHIKEKEELISKLQDTADDIMDIAIHQCKLNTRFVKSIIIDIHGGYKVHK